MNLNNSGVQVSDSKGITLSVMRCTTCGEKVKYKDGDNELVCLACGNTFLVNEKNKNNEIPSTESMSKTTLKIEGIKTSSSALAYIEQFLDSYDWEAFAFNSDIFIDELEEVIESIKMVSADDYKTWIASFISRVIPFSKKMEFRSKIYQTIVAEYKKENLDVYGMYEVYKTVSSSLIDLFDSVKEKASLHLNYAKKYNAPKDEIDNLEQVLSKLTINQIRDTLFDSIEDIPEIQLFISKKEDELVDRLKSIGINASERYEMAQKLVEDRKYIQALEILYTLENYKQSKSIINKIDKLSILSDGIFLYNDKFYHYRKDISAQKYSLYETDSSKKPSIPVVEDVKTIITNYANILYYFSSSSNQIQAFDLNEKKQVLKTNRSFNSIMYLIRKEIAKGYFVENGTYETTGLSIVELDFKSNKMRAVINGIQSVVAFKDNYVHYVVKEMSDIESVEKTRICNLNTLEIYDISTTPIEVVDFFDKKLLYTIDQPTKYNKNLMIYDFLTNKQVLLESNIIGQCKVVNNKIFYFTVDNLDHQYLISIDKDGKNRIELSPYVKEVLFSSGEWLYFIKSYKYNTALCKMRFDGSNTRTIASQIEKFIKIDNGYLFYIDDSRNLHKVRMDGAKNKTLCYSVTNVLKISSNLILYTAEDHNKTTSIYAIDFQKEGRRKAVYNVLQAKLYDDNTIYYTHLQTNEIKNTDGTSDYRKRHFVSKLNILTFEESKVLENIISEKTDGCYVASCIYDSYDCPQVWRLRRYRDYYLATHWWGRVFINFYYATSPKLVLWFGKEQWFRKPMKSLLEKILIKLAKSGYLDTPYSDKG